MKKFFTGFAAAALAAIVGFSGMAPASAAPLSTSPIVASSSVVPVQYNPDAPPPRRMDRRGRDNVRPGYRNDDHPGFRRGPPRDRRGNWHGFRGYEQRRPGYRRHSDGFWYPSGAFRIQIR